MLFLKVRVLLLLVGFLFVINSQIFGNWKFIRNSINDINDCEGKIKLNLIRVWGADNVEDENQFFRMPRDIKINKDGVVCVVDSGNNRIQLFERNTRYKMTLGRQGQGPGDLLFPGSIAFDNNNNYVVADSNNHRVQIFDSNGSYLDSFKINDGRPSALAVTHNNEIAVYSYQKSYKSRSLIFIYDSKGKLKRKIGKIYDKSKRLTNFESIYFAPDKNDNFFVSFYATPFYEKYSYEGESLMIVTYEVPFKSPIVNFDDSMKKIQVKGERKGRISAGISVDKMGRVYLIVVSRPLKKKERFFLVSDGDGALRRYPKNIESENTDRFRLLVFNDSGKIIAAQKLAVFCDNIYVQDNTLFIVDTYMGMKIYEYNLSFK
jgi:hypothetical protein